MRRDLHDQLAVVGLDPATGNPATSMAVSLGGGTLLIATSPPTAFVATGNRLLLEDGSYRLLEDGSKRLLEA